MRIDEWRRDARNLRRTRASVTRMAAVAAIVWTTLGWQATASARDRLAVMILVEDDQPGDARTLSDNLTEVAISELAEGTDRELVGARELRALLEQAREEGGLVGCSSRPTCLAQLGELAAAPRAVIGSVHRQATSYALGFALVEPRSARHLSEVSRTVPRELPALIAAVRDGVEALLSAGESAPVTSLLPRPPTHVPDGSRPVGATLSAPSASTPPSATVETSRGPSFVSITGFGAAGLAVVAFSASAVLGVIADEPPSGTTRAQKEMDLSRRVRDADLANAFLLTGALLTTVAAAALIWHLRH